MKKDKHNSITDELAESIAYENSFQNETVLHDKISEAETWRKEFYLLLEDYIIVNRAYFDFKRKLFLWGVFATFFYFFLGLVFIAYPTAPLTWLIFLPFFPLIIILKNDQSS